jgi:hypothetical protein
LSLRTTVIKTGGIVALTLAIAASSLIASPDMAFAKKKKKDRKEAPQPDIEMCVYHKHDAPYVILISGGDKRLDNTDKFRAPIGHACSIGSIKTERKEGLPE